MLRRPLVEALLLGLTGATAYTPGTSQILGPELTCMVHRLLLEKSVALLPDLLPAGSLRRRQVWDSLVTGEMAEGVGDCNGSTATPPPEYAGATRPVPRPSVARLRHTPCSLTMSVVMMRTAGPWTTPSRLWQEAWRSHVPC